MKKSIKLAVAAASLAAVGATALAAAQHTSTSTNDALNAPTKVISLQQAIDAATQHMGGGHATRAELEQSGRQQWVIDVEMIKDQVVTDVRVDAMKGAILSAKADGADRGEDDEGDSGKRGDTRD